MLLLVREGKMIKVFSCITLTFTVAPPPLRRFLFRSHPLVRFYVWCICAIQSYFCLLSRKLCNVEKSVLASLFNVLVLVSSPQLGKVSFVSLSFDRAISTTWWKFHLCLEWKLFQAWMLLELFVSGIKAAVIILGNWLIRHSLITRFHASVDRPWSNQNKNQQKIDFSCQTFRRKTRIHKKNSRQGKGRREVFTLC